MSDIDILNFDPGAIVVAVVPVLLWVLALVFAGVAIARAPRPLTRGFVVDQLLRYLFLFPLGLQGIWAFLCQVFLAEDTAAAIGWEPSPFQFEVGVANLGLGLASFYAAFSVFGARAAVAIVAGCFLGGAGVGHLIDIAQGDSLTAGNAGPILYTDFLTPIVVLTLLLLVPRSSAQVAARPAKIESAPAKDPQAKAPRTAEAPRPAKTPPLAKIEPVLAKIEAVLAKSETSRPKIETSRPKIETSFPKIETSPPKIETSPPKIAEKPPQAAKPPSIEDELETARKSMRESLRAGPKPELLAPQKPVDTFTPRKGSRRGKHLPEPQD